MLDDDDKIADALDRLHAGEWSVGNSMFPGPGGLVLAVIGSNVENRIQAEGPTCVSAD